MSALDLRQAAELLLDCGDLAEVSEEAKEGLRFLMRAMHRAPSDDAKVVLLAPEDWRILQRGVRRLAREDGDAPHWRRIAATIGEAL